jgi:phosphatidylglycerophosphate synthase
MLDRPLRARLQPALSSTGAALHERCVRASAVTIVGLVVGVGACVAAALAAWPLALVLWLANRALDGLDGALARLEGPTDLGGLLDLTADFVVYGGFVVAVAIAEPDARVACTVLLAAYLLNNVVLLSLSALSEKRALALGDERSIVLPTGLAEGTETIAVYCLLCLLPSAAAPIAYGFAAVVLATVVQRLAVAGRLLR